LNLRRLEDGLGPRGFLHRLDLLFHGLESCGEYGPGQLGYVLAIADSGCDPFRRTNEMLCPFVSLLACAQRHAARIESDELPPEVMIGDVPSWAFDVYSREGRAALARFSKLMRPPLDGYGATSARRADSHSSGISSSGSRAALSSIECDGRRLTSFAARSIRSARAAAAPTQPKPST